MTHGRRAGWVRDYRRGHHLAWLAAMALLLVSVAFTWPRASTSRRRSTPRPAPYGSACIATPSRCGPPGVARPEAASGWWWPAGDPGRGDGVVCDHRPRTQVPAEARTHPCTSLTPSYWQGKPRLTRGPGMWIAGDRHRTLGARTTFRRHPDPWQRQGPCGPASDPSSALTLLGKRSSIVLQCDMTEEVA